MIPESKRPGVASSALRFKLKESEHDWKPQRLENGKWACNHKCKDKAA